MKWNRNYQIVSWILALLPLAAVGLLYSRLPQEIPMQWDFGGEVGYEPKWHIWIIAGMAPLFNIMFRVLPQIDPRSRNYQKFDRGYQLFQCLMMVFLGGMVSIILIEGLHPGTVDVKRVVILFLAVLFLFIGNEMPKFRQNYFCGFKNPWTLSSQTVWTRTHRLGGRMLFAAGILCLVAIFTPPVLSFVLVFGSLLVATVYPSVMSYLWYRREQGQQS